MGKILILSVTDHEEHILNKIMETIANEPKLNHIAPPLPCNILSFKNLEIRLKEQTVSCRGQLVTLTHHEFAVLTYLARHPGWVFSASQIYEAVWDRDGEHWPASGLGPHADAGHRTADAVCAWRTGSCAPA